MRVITTSGTRNVEVVLRDYALSNSYDVVIRNESTNETETITVVQTVETIKAIEDFFVFELSDAYNEDAELDFYIVETGETKILHRNKIFVTGQSTQDFSYILLENGDALLLESNDFILLED